MLKIHNAMWPGLVGKGQGADEPAISWDRMLDFTTAAEANSNRFEGIDIILMHPHLDVNSTESEIKAMADQVAARDLLIGSVVAPVWPESGGGSAMGTAEERKRFIEMVKSTCVYAQTLNRLGIRKYGVVRIDSADSPGQWRRDPLGNSKTIAKTFKEAALIAADFGEHLAAEGEICWAGMHSWHHMLEVLEMVGMPETLGFQADLAHTYLFLLGYNAPEHRLIKEEHSEEQFWHAYKKMTDALGPWTFDFHVAQSNGTVFGSGSHDKTGRHCPADAEDGKLDVTRCSEYWLLDEGGNIRNNIQHICWDGCMFPNQILESSQTWQRVLSLMVEVRKNIKRLQHE